MRKSIKIKAPSPAMVVASVALFVALGGSAYAIGRNSVGTPQLKNNAVISSKVRDGSLKAGDFGNGQLPTGSSGYCAGTCQTLTDAYERMGTPATVKVGSSGRLFASASVGVYQDQGLAGPYSEAQCRIKASGPGLGALTDVSLAQYGEVRALGQDVMIPLVGSLPVGAGTYEVGVYCLGLQASQGETTKIYNVDLVAFGVR